MQVRTLSTDLSVPSAVRDVADAVADVEVGLLIHNAGANTHSAQFLDGDLAAFQRVIDLNITTPLALVHHFGAPMRDRRRGGILLVGSVAGYLGSNRHTVYGGVKAFGRIFTESLWLELRDHDVDVLELVLGVTRTPAMDRVGLNFDIPGMAVSEPDEVAREGLAALGQTPVHVVTKHAEVARAHGNPDRAATILRTDEVMRRLIGPADPVRLGLSTPVVIQRPAHRLPWEKDAGPADLAAIAAAADTLGFHHLTCSEHIGIPAQAADTRGAVYWDPLATLSFWPRAHPTHPADDLGIGARLSPSCRAVQELRDAGPAQRGTRDRGRGGRLAARGIRSPGRRMGRPRGAGRCRTAPTAGRLGQPVVDGLAIEPHATSTDLTVWVGGRTLRSLRRAIDLGNGWMPFGLSPDTIAGYLARHPAPAGFEVVLSTGRACDPLRDPAGTRSQLERLRDAGATLVTCVVRADNADHYREQLSALHEIGHPL